MRKIDKFCIIVYFKDFVGRVLKIKHISHFHPLKKNLFSVSPSNQQHQLSPVRHWKLQMSWFCPAAYITCLLVLTDQQRDLLSVLSCLASFSPDILKTDFHVRRRFRPLQLRSTNAAPRCFSSSVVIGRIPIGHRGTQKQDPASNWKHWSEKEEWLSWSFLGSWSTFFFFQNCVLSTGIQVVLLGWLLKSLCTTRHPWSNVADVPVGITPGSNATTSTLVDPALCRFLK